MYTILGVKIEKCTWDCSLWWSQSIQSTASLQCNIDTKHTRLQNLGKVQFFGKEYTENCLLQIVIFFGKSKKKIVQPLKNFYYCNPLLFLHYTLQLFSLLLDCSKLFLKSFVEGGLPGILKKDDFLQDKWWEWSIIALNWNTLNPSR